MASVQVEELDDALGKDDPHPFERSGIHKNSNWITAAMLLSNISIGTAMLSYGYSFANCGGILNSLLIQILCVISSQIGLLMICYCSDLCGKDTLPDIVGFSAGKIGRAVANACVIVQDLGCGLGCLVVLADQMDQLMHHVRGDHFCHYWYSNRMFTLTCAAFVLIYPVLLLKNISSLKFSSVLGILSTTFLTFSIIYKSAFRTSPVLPDEPVSINNLFHAIPIFVTSYQSHVEVAPVYASFKKRNLKELSKAVALQTILVFLTYNLAGIFAYLTFGKESKSDIIANYQPVDTIILLTMAVLALKQATTLPVVFFPPRLVVIELFDGLFSQYSLYSRNRNLRRYFIVTVMFILLLTLALSFKNVGSVLSLLGASGSLAMYVLPGLCLVLGCTDFKSKYNTTKLCVGSLYMIIGAFLFGAILSQSILGYINGENSTTDVICI